jgi:rSAM/selenodomain-associated transferase 1
VDDNCLIVFVKNPELGKVKTRLAEGVGDEKALKIYLALMTHTRQISLEIDAKRMLFYHASIAQDEWSTLFFEKHIQTEGDLGTKMNAAFKSALTQSKKAVIIGSDCAQISSELILEAFDSLNSHDLVIGPTFDGGYYLLGMKILYTYLFENITWSTPSVFQETIASAEEYHLKTKVLTTLSDIDYKEDWDKYGWNLE